MKLKQIPRLLRTVRHLKWSQIGYRLYYMGERRLRANSVKAIAIDQPPVANFNLDIPLPPFDPTAAVDQIEQLTNGQLTMLNQSLEFSANSPDWRLGSQPKNRLWIITLHYHQWLYELLQASSNKTLDSEVRSLAEKTATMLLNDWLDKCQPSAAGVRDLAWNSYAISTRILWWIRTLINQGRDYFESPDNSFDLAAITTSLEQQAEFLFNHLEWDLAANHLMKNAVALCWAGSFLECPNAKKWLKTGTKIALEQAIEQVHDDGGHFEHSPMYHVEFMGDLDDLRSVLPQHSAQLSETYDRMSRFANWLCHPDGKTAQFNDGKQIAPSIKASSSSSPLSMPPRGGRWFKETGVVAWHDATWSLFFDIGHVGPNYQPGHAHADTLSIEASYQGERLFVDPGCFHYDLGEIRQSDRSTATHNTVCIDEEDSSEVWHIFRVGRRASPCDVKVEFAEDQLTASGSHDGYDHLPGRPRHLRTIQLSNDDTLTIHDEISGNGTHNICGGYLLAPGWHAEVTGQGWLVSRGERQLQVTLSSSCCSNKPEANKPDVDKPDVDKPDVDKPSERSKVQGLRLSVESQRIHPDYGVRQDALRIQWQYQGAAPLTVNVTVAPS